MKKTVKMCASIALAAVLCACSTSETKADPKEMTGAVPVKTEEIEKLEKIYHKSGEEVKAMYEFAEGAFAEVNANTWELQEKCTFDGNEYAVFLDAVTDTIAQIRYSCAFEDGEEALTAGKNLYQRIVEEYGEPEEHPEKPETAENVFAAEDMKDTGSIHASQYWKVNDHSQIKLELFRTTESDPFVLAYNVLSAE